MSALHARERAGPRILAVVTPRRRMPSVSIGLRRAMPAWALRVIIAMLATGCALLVVPSAGYWLIAVPIIATMSAWPGSNATTHFVLGAGLAVLTSPAPPFGFDLYLLVFGVHLTLELAAVVGDVPWACRVELEVLTRSTGRFVVIQLVGQAVTLLGDWATSARPPLGWLPVAAGIALAATGWSLLIRLRSPG